MAWLSTASFNPFSSLLGPYVAASPLSSASPDWVLLDKTARISAFRNATTAVCDTGEGQAVEATFWLVDPPAVSYLSVHCPGHGEDDFSGEPVVVCAEAAFVLFRVSLISRGQEDSTYHFIYAARGAAGKPSLRLLPPPPHPDAQLGLLPCDGDHYAVAFLDRKWTARDQAWHFHAYVFSTKTQAWRKKPAASSEPGRPMLRTSKQITVGATSLGWVDISHGITLLCDVLHECPVIKYIPFPAPLPSKSLVPAECLRDAPFPVPLPSKALVPAECLRDVSCCDHLIKFVQVEFDEPGCRMKGKRWTATTWTRKFSGNNWRICTRVDVAAISVDPRYSAVLPELWDDVNQELELKKLLFLGPILAVGNCDRLYMIAKVDEKDSKDWVVAVDMKNAAVEGLAPVSTQRYSPTTLFSPCAFPSYLTKTTPGDKWEDPSGGSDGGILEEEEEKSQAGNRMGGPDMGNPVDKYFKRISASQCVLQVLLTQSWLRQLDKWLDSQDSTCIECRRLLRFSCPASALRFDIHFVVKYASYSGQGKAASKCVDFCLRALDDFDELLWESPLRDPSTAEALKSQIGVLLGVLDHILEFVPLRDMPRRVQTVLAGVCLKQERVIVFGHCDKPCHAKGRSDEQKQSGRSNPSNSGEAQKKKKKNKKKKKQQQQQVLVLDRRLLVQSYLLYFVGSVLVVVAVKALCRHLGSV